MKSLICLVDLPEKVASQRDAFKVFGMLHFLGGRFRPFFTAKVTLQLVDFLHKKNAHFLRNLFLNSPHLRGQGFSHRPVLLCEVLLDFNLHKLPGRLII